MKEGNVQVFRLYIPPKDSFRHQYHSMLASKTADLQGIHLVENPEAAQLTISTLDDHLTFTHMDERVTAHGMHLVRDGVESDLGIVGGILESAARYFRELNRTTDPHDIADLIEVEFYELGAPKILVAGRSGLEQLKPVGPNLCRKNNENTLVIDFEVSDTANTAYGFKVISNAQDDLYLNAFYFDNATFGIGEFECNLPSART